MVLLSKNSKNVDNLYIPVETFICVRNQEDRYCIVCKAVLPDRYKGRARIYCGDDCRNAYTKRKVYRDKKAVSK